MTTLLSNPVSFLSTLSVTAIQTLWFNSSLADMRNLSQPNLNFIVPNLSSTQINNAINNIGSSALWQAMSLAQTKNLTSSQLMIMIPMLSASQLSNAIGKLEGDALWIGMTLAQKKSLTPGQISTIAPALSNSQLVSASAVLDNSALWTAMTWAQIKTLSFTQIDSFWSSLSATQISNAFTNLGASMLANILTTSQINGLSSSQFNSLAPSLNQSQVNALIDSNNNQFSLFSALSTPQLNAIDTAHLAKLIKSFTSAQIVSASATLNIWNTLLPAQLSSLGVNDLSSIVKTLTMSQVQAQIRATSISMSAFWTALQWSQINVLDQASLNIIVPGLSTAQINYALSNVSNSDSSGYKNFTSPNLFVSALTTSQLQTWWNSTSDLQKQYVSRLVLGAVLSSWSNQNIVGLISLNVMASDIWYAISLNQISTFTQAQLKIIVPQLQESQVANMIAISLLFPLFAPLFTSALSYDQIQTWWQKASSAQIGNLNTTQLSDIAPCLTSDQVNRALGSSFGLNVNQQAALETALTQGQIQTWWAGTAFSTLNSCAQLNMAAIAPKLSDSQISKAMLSGGLNYAAAIMLLNSASATQVQTFWQNDSWYTIDGMDQGYLNAIVPKLSPAQIAAVIAYNAISMTASVQFNILTLQQQLLIEGTLSNNQTQSWWTNASPAQKNALDQQHMNILVPKLSDVQITAAMAPSSPLTASEMLLFSTAFTSAQVKTYFGNIFPLDQSTTLNQAQWNSFAPWLSNAQMETAMSAVSGLTASQQALLASALSPRQTATLTIYTAYQATPVWWNKATWAQINGLTQAQMTATVPNLNTTQVATALSATLALTLATRTNFANALTTTQINVLTLAQMAGIVSYMSSAQVAVVLSVTSALSGASLANFANTLTPAQLTALTSSPMINGLTPAQMTAVVQYLSTAQVTAALSPKSMLSGTALTNFAKALTPTQINALTTTQINGLTQPQMTAIVPMLSAAQVTAALSAIPALSAALTNFANGLTPTQISGLNSVQMTAIVPALNTTQVAAALSPTSTLAGTPLFNFANNLTTNQLNTLLTSLPSNGLTQPQMAAIVPALNTTQVAAALSPTSALAGAQLTLFANALTTNQLNTLLTSTQMNGFTQPQMATIAPLLSNAQVTAALSAIPAMSGTALALFANTLTPSQVAAALSPTSALAGLALTSFAHALTPSQINALTSTQINGLTLAQMTAIVPALNSTQVAAALSPTSALSGAALTNFANALTPSQISTLMATQFSGLTPAQMAAIAPNLNTNQVATILTTTLNAALNATQNTIFKTTTPMLTPAAMRVLLGQFANDLSTDQIGNIATITQMSAVVSSLSSPKLLQTISDSNTFSSSGKTLLADALSTSQISLLPQAQMTIVVPYLDGTYLAAAITASSGFPAGQQSLFDNALAISQIGALNSTQMAAIVPNLSARQLAQFITSMPGFTSSQQILFCNALTSNQIALLAQPQMALAVPCLNGSYLTSAITASLSFTAPQQRLFDQALSTSQIAGLSQTQAQAIVPNLSSAQVTAVLSATPALAATVLTQYVDALASSQIAVLAQPQMALAVPYLNGSYLTAAITASMSFTAPQQRLFDQALSTSQIAGLSQTQTQAIVPNLSAAQVTAVLSATPALADSVLTQFADALASSQIAVLAQPQMTIAVPHLNGTYLTAAITASSGFTTAQQTLFDQALTSSQLAGLTAAQMKAVAPNLSTAQVTAILSATPALADNVLTWFADALSTSQIAMLAQPQMAIAVAHLDGTSLTSAITNSTGFSAGQQILFDNALTPSQIGALNTTQMSAVVPNLSAAQVTAALSAIPALSDTALALLANALTPSQIGALNTTQMAAVVPKLNPVQVAAVMAAVPVPSSAAQSAAQNAITSALTATQAETFWGNATTVQITALTSAQLTALVPKLSNAQVATAMSTATPTLSPAEQILFKNAMSQAQTSALKAASTVSAAAELALSPAATSAQLQEWWDNSPDQLDGLTQAQLNLLVPNLTTAQVAAGISSGSGFRSAEQALFDNALTIIQISALTQAQMTAVVPLLSDALVATVLDPSSGITSAAPLAMFATAMTQSQITHLSSTAMLTVAPLLSATQVLAAISGTALTAAQQNMLAANLTPGQIQTFWASAAPTVLNGLSLNQMNSMTPLLTAAEVAAAMSGATGLTAAQQKVCTAGLTQKQIQDFWDSATPAVLNGLSLDQMSTMVQQLSPAQVTAAMSGVSGLNPAQQKVFATDLVQNQIQIFWSNASSSTPSTILNNLSQVQLGIMAPLLLDDQVLAAVTGTSGLNAAQQIGFVTALVQTQILTFWSTASSAQLNILSQGEMNFIVKPLSDAQVAAVISGAALTTGATLSPVQQAVFAKALASIQVQTWWLNSPTLLSNLNQGQLSAMVPKLTDAEVAAEMAAELNGTSVLTAAQLQLFPADLTQTQVRAWWGAALATQLNGLNAAQMMAMAPQLSDTQVAAGIAATSNLTNSQIQVLATDISTAQVHAVFASSAYVATNLTLMSTLISRATDADVSVLLESGNMDESTLWKDLSTKQISNLSQTDIDAIVPFLTPAQITDAKSNGQITDANIHGWNAISGSGEANVLGALNLVTGKTNSAVSTAPGTSYASTPAYLTAMGFQNAWGNGATGKGIVIADIGSGMSSADMNNTILMKNVTLGANFAGDGTYQDTNGLGTSTSEELLAAAPDASLLIVKTTNASGFASATAIANAIRYAIGQGVNVINLSLPNAATSTTINTAIQAASDAGIIVCISAGATLSGGNTTAPAYSGIANVIYVGATQKTGIVYSMPATSNQASAASNSGNAFVNVISAPITSMANGSAVTAVTKAANASALVAAEAAILLSAMASIAPAAGSTTTALANASKVLGAITGSANVFTSNK